MVRFKGPDEYETWSAGHQEILDRLIQKMDEHFKKEGQRELNIDINTYAERIDIEIWEKFVQQANDAGWVASRRGAHIRIKKPSTSGFTVGTVERG
jgi:hypothetical protein